MDASSRLASRIRLIRFIKEQEKAAQEPCAEEDAEETTMRFSIFINLPFHFGWVEFSTGENRLSTQNPPRKTRLDGCPRENGRAMAILWN